MIIDLKRNFISPSVSRSPATEPQKVSFILEMANLGYLVPVQAVEKASITELKKLLSGAKNFRGANHAWTPMYPNFPQQVIDAPYAELFWNALIHYAGSAFDLNVRPEYPVQLREVLKVLPESLQLLEIKSEREILESKIGFLQNKVSLSEADFEEIGGYLKEYGIHDSVKLLSGFKFSNKENWVSAIKLAQTVGVSRDTAFQISLDTASTPTDLLRAIFMLFSDSNVHIDLTVNKNVQVKLNNIPRPLRKEIVATIDEKFSDNLDDFFLNKKLWKIVDRKVHPGDFSNYKNAMKAFDVVRGNVAYKTFNSRWQSAIAQGGPTEVASVLSERPGVFARNLDFALRSFDTNGQTLIANAFEKVANRVSSTVLVSLYNGLSNRGNASSVIRTKSGATANVTNVKADINQSVIENVQRSILKALETHFAGKEALGKVYVSPELKNYFAPLQQRTVSDGRVLPRGSRLSIPDTNLRFFVQWYNSSESYGGRVDIDMDAIFLDATYRQISNVSYTNLRNGYATHSGDLTNAPRPKGAAEFVDVDTELARNAGVKYVVMSFNVYSGPPLSEIENYTGFMTRNDPNIGEIFDPKTIHTSFTSTASGRNAIPVVFDLESNQMVWLDSSFGQAQSGFSAYRDAGSVAETVRLELDKKQLTMYDLIVANVNARGTLVDKEDADKVFSEDNVDPFDANGFIAEFL